ncbi:germinal-center associated nuclear protein [Nephila pilipes]|uniref:Germinal-center associated nuclear protein n=1 Tax=Nephila pilipes TaxID=299642 RepID=A0A8X6QM60_NEPPI|nr:germinal-center associated nuclear protein [Nephila pilipes]
MDNKNGDKDLDLEIVAGLDDYVVIPRPHSLIQSQLQSSTSKDKQMARESTLRKTLKERLLKEKALSRDGKKNLIKERSGLHSKVRSRSKLAQELDQKFEAFLEGAKKAMKRGSSRLEMSKITKEDSEKVSYRSSPSKEDTSKQELQLFKSMQEVAFTPLERYEVLNTRDNYLRLRDGKKGDSKVKKVNGVCPDMCPEKERYGRIAKNCLAIFETKMAFDSMSSSKDVDHRYMVKEYSRSSADQQEPLPHELRPVSVLKFTMDYLICNVIDRKNLNISIADWYDFIWNRTRSIRKDITQQQLCDVECVDILEKCARFHILCAELLSEEDTATFDPKINNENLTKCLQTLKHMYHDLQTKGIQCPNEAEFRAYDILLSLTEGETLRLVKDLRKDIFKSPPVKAAFEAALAFRSNNYVKFFQLMEKGTYLDCCIMHRYMHEARVQAMQVIIRAYSVPNNPTLLPLICLVKDLKFENTIDAANFCRWHGLTVDDTFVTIQRQTFQMPSSTYPISRATLLVGNKLLTTYSEIINNGPLQQNPLQWYQPHDSFSEEGILLNKIIPGIVTGKENEEDQEMDVEQTDTASIISKSSAITSSTPKKLESLKVENKIVFDPLVEKPSKNKSFVSPNDKSALFDFSKNNYNMSDVIPEEANFVSSQEISTSRTSSSFFLSKSLPKTINSLDSNKSLFMPAEKSKANNLQSDENLMNSHEWSSSTIPTPITVASTTFSFKSPAEHSSNSQKERKNSILHSPDNLNVSSTNISVSKFETFEKASSKSFHESSENKKLIGIEDFDEQRLDEMQNEHFEELSSDIEDRNYGDLFTQEKNNEDSSLELDMENEETLQKLREQKMNEIVINVSDEVSTECIEGLLAEICEASFKEEWDKKIKLENNLERMRLVLAKNAIYKWKLFCERRKQRKMYQNTEPISPWLPMLMNTEYVTSGATSPFSVYKKHCFLSRLTDSKLKQRERKPGWESLAASDFELLNNLSIFPLGYLKTFGINRFFKLCIVFVTYSDFDGSTFIEWMCKKFKLSALSGNSNEKSKLLSFYTLNSGKTLICIQAVILESQMNSMDIDFLKGTSAMILCIPKKFPNAQIYKGVSNQLHTLFDSETLLPSFPLFTFLLPSTEKYDIVNELSSYLDSRLYSRNTFSTLKMNQLSIPSFINYSDEILCAVKWLIENQENAPMILSSSFYNYLEDSFASVFNTLLWKISLQEYKPLSQMPQQIIIFYNKMLDCRANLLCSNFLLKVSEWWPPNELYMLQPEYRFIDVSLQRKCQDLMRNSHLPEFHGDPFSSSDLWHYVKQIADIVDSNKETLFLSVQSILRLSSNIDWLSIISKCANHILCNYCSNLENYINESIYYMKPDLDAINCDSFWQSFLSSLKQHHSLKKKRKIYEPFDESFAKVIKSDSGLDILFNNSDKVELKEFHLVDEKIFFDEFFNPEKKVKRDCAVSDIPDIPDNVNKQMDNLLSSLKSALKKQNEESDKFMDKLNESLSGKNCFTENSEKNNSFPIIDLEHPCEMKQFLQPGSFISEKEAIKESDDATDNFIFETSELKLGRVRFSDFPEYMHEANGVKDTSSDISNLLGRQLPSTISSASSISQKLLELKYNIQKNNILEDNLGSLLEL